MCFQLYSSRFKVYSFETGLSKTYKTEYSITSFANTGLTTTNIIYLPNLGPLLLVLFSCYI